MAFYLDPVKSTALVPYNPQAHPLEKAKLYALDMQNLFTEKSKIQEADNCSLHGKIIVLVGGSTAGKSTIINGLKSLDKEMIEEGSDLTGANFIYEFMQQNHEQFGVTKEDFEHLHAVLVPRNDHWHIHEAVGKDIESPQDAYEFLPYISEEEQLRAIRSAKALHKPVCAFAESTEKSIDTIVMNKVIENAKNGNNVVFDILDIEKVIEHPISKYTSIKSVFVYCPFGKLTERLAERNRKALNGEVNPSEARLGVFPLLQYSELVRARQESDLDEDVIDKVTKKTVEDDFDINFDAWIKSQTEESLSKIEGGQDAKRAKEKQILLTAFGFTESDGPLKTHELVPKKSYSLRIDTSDPLLGATPAERGNSAAKKIFNL